MRLNHHGRGTLVAALIAASVLWMTACGGRAHRARPAATAIPKTTPITEPALSAPPLPTFQKVPPEENPALLDPSSADNLAAGGLYRLDVEDKLDISVYGEGDLQHVEVPVRPDGMISFAFIGDVLAAGRTVEEIRSEMTRRLGQYLRTPEVTIIAKQFAQKKIFVGGEVKNPGVLYMGGREGTLIDALYKAGLVTEKADLNGAYLIRANKLVAADFKELVRGNMVHNLRLMDQDLIYVPEGLKRFVYVVGEVTKNDALPVSQPVPIIEILSRAGGFTDDAKKREIAVVRGGLKSPEVAYINAKRLMEGDLTQNIMVQPGDIVYVATSALGHYRNFVKALIETISPIVQATIVSDVVNP